MRSCKVALFGKDVDRFKFHTFGFITDDCGKHSAIAIVECDNGSVMEVPATSVVFTDIENDITSDKSMYDDLSIGDKVSVADDGIERIGFMEDRFKEQGYLVVVDKCAGGFVKVGAHERAIDGSTIYHRYLKKLTGANTEFSYGDKVIVSDSGLYGAMLDYHNEQGYLEVASLVHNDYVRLKRSVDSDMCINLNVKNIKKFRR